MGDKSFNYVNAFYKPTDNPGPNMGGESNKIFNNIAGTINYGSALVVTPDPSSLLPIQKSNINLGNRYFMNTNTECKNKEGDVLSRHIYIDNVPSGIVSEILEGGGGLIPGMISNIERANPTEFLNSFSLGEKDKRCFMAKLKTIEQEADGRSIEGTAEAPITCADAKTITSSVWVNGKDDMLNKECEGFKSIEEIEEIEENNYSNMPNDILMQIYLSSLSIIGLYIIIKLINKR
tara:strand:- start:2340 stop:3044 length:705 start_codon:yes stop_codon:yes gene_type:complete